MGVKARFYYYVSIGFDERAGRKVILRLQMPMAMTPSELHPDFLLAAYAQGYFPMGSAGSDQVDWFNPDPRAVIPLEGFHVSRSLAKALRKNRYTFTRDLAFSEVMAGCAEQREVWITEAFLQAYQALHGLGFAHSVEVWDADRLVGGTYGVALGAAFCAESMFHREPDTSKMALNHLVGHLRARGFQLLDVQFLTPHLITLGACEMPKQRYLHLLRQAIAQSCLF